MRPSGSARGLIGAILLHSGGGGFCRDLDLVDSRTVTRGVGRTYHDDRPALGCCQSLRTNRNAALDALVRAPAVDRAGGANGSSWCGHRCSERPSGRGVTAAIREGMQRADASARGVSKRVTRSASWRHASLLGDCVPRVRALCNLRPRQPPCHKKKRRHETGDWQKITQEKTSKCPSVLLESIET